MPHDISIAQCKLIAISSLEGKERDRAKQEWEERFLEHEAFWVDAQANQKASALAQNITAMMREHEIVALAGETVVVAVFLDLTKAPDEGLLQEIVKLPAILTKLGCLAPIVLEFGFLDDVVFGDAETLKENIRKTVAINCLDTTIRKQLLLVATSSLVQREDDTSWKAVMIALDILRRDGAPANMVPVDGVNPNNNIGFLRYGEYDEQKLQALLKEQETLRRKLSNSGAMEFKNALNMVLGKIETDVAERFVVDGNCQPLHPGVKVEGFFQKKAAARGKEPFAAARNSTWNALDMTAKNLKTMIHDAYQEQIAGAPVYLKQYIEKADIGIELESDSAAMLEMLDPEPIGMSEPMTPNLAYKESGYSSEIDGYLKDVRRYCAAKARYEFAVALRDAYKEIPQSEYAQRRSVLAKELKNVGYRISMLMDKKSLINLIATGGNLPQANIHIARGGGNSACWALCRDPEDSAVLGAACTGALVSVYYIDAKFGGLKLLDNAPIKAVQLLQFHCSEERLSDLIG